MERKIGETFEFEGKKLQVKESEEGSCNFCFFNEECKNRNLHVSGACDGAWRDDGKNVIFVEVQEQPQPQKLNLCEILKDCPKGEMFWSPVFGDVWFYDIDQLTKRVKVRTSGVGSWYINADGTITIDKVTSPEIMLYPSRKQRDWSKFTAPWLEKQGEQTSLQTNERAWLYLISDVLTWKDGIGQYLDDSNVQELAKKLCNKYAQKLYNPSVFSNSSNNGR